MYTKDYSRYAHGKGQCMDIMLNLSQGTVKEYDAYIHRNTVKENYGLH